MAVLSSIRIRAAVVCSLLLLSIGLAGCGQTYEFAGTPFVPVLDAPDVTGVVGDGKDFTLSGLPEKVKLVFFGYTSCPDICPLTLSSLQNVYEQLSSPERADVAVVLISVDPQRDTPARLATYTAAFNPSFYGVHIPEERLTQLLDEFNVFAAKRSLTGGTDDTNYLMDHTAVVFVVDGKNQLREIFPSNAPADQIAADVRYLLAQ
jgi:protein SCO1/2